MRVLYLIDHTNDDTARLVRRYLASHQHETHVARGFEQAWEALRRQPSLILLALHSDNFQANVDFAHELRHLGYMMPIVIVADCIDREQAQACWSAGIDDFLISPFTLARLAQTITRYTPA